MIFMHNFDKVNGDEAIAILEQGYCVIGCYQDHHANPIDEPDMRIVSQMTLMDGNLAYGIEVMGSHGALHAERDAGRAISFCQGYMLGMARPQR